MFAQTEKPGPAAPDLVADMPMEQYQKRREALSKSMLSEMDCPKKFKYQYLDGNEEEEQDYFNIGSAVHTLALEPDHFEARFHILPATYINGDGKELPFKRDKRMAVYKEQVALAAGRKLIPASSYADIKGMAASILADPTALALLNRPGLIEASIFWTDPETGIQHKCRPDFLSDDGLIIDIKTAQTAKPGLFSKHAFDNKYDLSVALTTRGFKALRGKAPDNYVFIIIESSAPYVVECMDAFRPWDDEDPAALSYYDAGSHRLDVYLARYQECIKTGVWPGYSGGKIMPMSVPGYGLKQLEKGAA